jgi:quinoprotein glucose dehydrogenase
MRMEAVEALGDWAEPSQRDRVNGFWRPLGRRDPAIVKGLLSELADGFLKEKNTQLLTRAIEFGTKLGSQTDPEVMLAIVKDDRAEASLRLSALRRLADRRVAVLDQALQVSMASTTPSIRSEGRKILSQIDPVQAVRSLQVVLDNSTTPMVERQESVKILEALNHPQADALLGDWLARLADGKAPSELEMELIEAARARPSRHVAEVLDKLERSRSKTDVLSSFRASLRGGDATKGQAVFNGNRMAQCTRCHLVNGKGGTAGPDLTKVATRADREFLLQSLVDPDAKISQGFGTVAFALRDGRVITGVLKGETSLAVTVEAPDGRVIQVPLAEVEERSSSKSAMPKMGTILSPREVRDVIEYLSTLK